MERIDRLAMGNPGDVKQVGQVVSELRLICGPGDRVYFVEDGETSILLVCGGDESTQQKDIDKAHQLADEWRTDKDASEDQDRYG